MPVGRLSGIDLNSATIAMARGRTASQHVLARHSLGIPRRFVRRLKPV